MRLLPNKWRWLGGLMGLLLIASGSFFAYWWYYKLAQPATRSTLDGSPANRGKSSDGHSSWDMASR